MSLQMKMQVMLYQSQTYGAEFYLSEFPLQLTLKTHYESVQGRMCALLLGNQ